MINRTICKLITQRLLSGEFGYCISTAWLQAAVLEFYLLFNKLLAVPLLFQDAIPSMVMTCIKAFPSSSNFFYLSGISKPEKRACEVDYIIVLNYSLPFCKGLYTSTHCHVTCRTVSLLKKYFSTPLFIWTLLWPVNCEWKWRIFHESRSVETYGTVLPRTGHGVARGCSFCLDSRMSTYETEPYLACSRHTEKWARRAAFSVQITEISSSSQDCRSWLIHACYHCT